MARVKTARITRKKHKKVLKQAKGYYGAKHYRFRNANQAVLKSLSYAYVGRKDKKSDFRKLWIARINAAARMNGTTYSKMIAGLKKANVTINRKMLAEIAVSDEKYKAIVAKLNPGKKLDFVSCAEYELFGQNISAVISNQVMVIRKDLVDDIIVIGCEVIALSREYEKYVREIKMSRFVNKCRE